MAAQDQAAVQQGAAAYLGRGLVAPLLREGGDFAVDVGLVLLSSNMARGLGIRQGEVPWDQSIGLDIERHRHQTTDTERAALIEASARATLEAIDPRIGVQAITVQVDRDQRNLTRGSVEWFLRDQGSGQTLAGPFSQEVVI